MTDTNFKQATYTVNNSTLQTETTNTFDITLTTDGEYNVVIHATDQAGNAADAVTIVIKRNTTAPVGTVGAPTGNSVSTSIRGSVVMNFNESITALSGKNVTISGDGTTYTAQATAGTITCSGNNYNVTTYKSECVPV